ncbi:unnamed protein product [Rangifer tarandus platyrhynchus]|uniref:Uncharacterized protein n=1 Tax=Rangifer tarandus platyrhynchus TaxID=3082113 RepID=A0AC59Y5M9_RANTA
MTLRPVVHQAPLSMKFSKQEHWNGLPFPSPGALANPEIEPKSPAFQADPLLLEPLQKLEDERHCNRRLLEDETPEAGTGSDDRFLSASTNLAKTQRDGMGREVGGGFRMGNTCKSVADSCQCMAKTTTIL